MKKFTRQLSTDIDFGAASAQVARPFESEVYGLHVEAARVVKSRSGNTSIALDLTEVESGGRVIEKRSRERKQGAVA